MKNGATGDSTARTGAGSRSSNGAASSGGGTGGTSEDAGARTDHARDRSGAADPGPDGGRIEVWVGQIVHAVTNGADAITGPPEHVVMVLTTTPLGSSGSIVFGDGAPPPAATDPSVFYPPLGSFGDQPWWGLRETLFNGFAYTLSDLRVRDGRLTAAVSPGELWKDWCSLQPKSYPTTDGYRCAPDYDPGPNPVMAPASVAGLCIGYGSVSVCICDQYSCHVDPSRYLFALDLELNGGAYEGEFASTAFTTGGLLLPGVRLRRVQ